MADFFFFFLFSQVSVCEQRDKEGRQEEGWRGRRIWWAASDERYPWVEREAGKGTRVGEEVRVVGDRDCGGGGRRLGDVLCRPLVSSSA